MARFSERDLQLEIFYVPGQGFVCPEDPSVRVMIHPVTGTPVVVSDHVRRGESVVYHGWFEPEERAKPGSVAKYYRKGGR